MSSNDLERLLGDIAEAAGRRSAPLPVAALLGAGRRRRAVRRAGAGVVGVAAAFGLVLGGAQLVPDRDGSGVAGTWPTAAPGALQGTCGSDMRNVPSIDGPAWIEVEPTDLSTAVGQRPTLTATTKNSGQNAIQDDDGRGPRLLVLRRGVVVGVIGVSEKPGTHAIPAQDASASSSWEPLRVCTTDGLAPSTALPVGTYSFYVARSFAAPSARSPEIGLDFETISGPYTLKVVDAAASAP